MKRSDAKPEPVCVLDAPIGSWVVTNKPVQVGPISSQFDVDGQLYYVEPPVRLVTLIACLFVSDSKVTLYAKSYKDRLYVYAKGTQSKPLRLFYWTHSTAPVWLKDCFNKAA